MLGEWKNKRKLPEKTEESVSQQASSQPLAEAGPVLVDGVWMISGKPWDRVEDLKLFIQTENKKLLETITRKFLQVETGGGMRPGSSLGPSGIQYGAGGIDPNSGGMGGGGN